MKKVAIIQARTGSERLPNKVLMPLCGKPMLQQQIERIQRCNLIDEIVIATTTELHDDNIVSLAKQLGVRYFRGSEHDVLSRYMGAAKEAKAELVIRMTADCPLLDPIVCDQVIALLADNPTLYDYTGNSRPRSFPHGLDTEAFWMDTLLRMDRMGSSSAAREHVTFFITEFPGLFSIGNLVDKEDNSGYRWTVDTPEDFAAVKEIYEQFSVDENKSSYQEILALLQSKPEITNINSHIKQRVPTSKYTSTT